MTRSGAYGQSKPGYRLASCRRWWAVDNGSASAFVVSFVVALLAMAGIALDGGLALAAKIRANGHAEAAARAGAQAIDLAAFRADGTVHLLPDQALADAYSYLAGIGATGTVSVFGDTVTVTVTTSQPTQLLGLVGIPTLHVHGEASAHPQGGIAGVIP
jgi:putative Flp pilus-assembly TadE/G-like protein